MVIRRHASIFASTLPRRALSTAVLSALLATPLLTRAQVTPDPNAGAHRPGTDTAANGVPVVNLVAPSAAGVSHNQYQQFNVDPQGLILNNAAGVSPTQLGGYITGNPHYQAGQSAKLIVNEVTSTNPTYLRGYTEVAGNAADVIVANPNGISVSGGGFINTPRATLTTGVPVFGGDGSLNAFHVTQGAIRIDGDGLNASNIDRLDLISRNLAVNGKVWANHLNVVTGANQVDYANLATQAVAGDGDAPAVSVDVAALGGMYAAKIHLVGTEAGIGVRNAGELATQSGDFTINAAGQLQMTGVTSSAGNLSINGAGLSNSGTVQSGGAMALQTGVDLINAGTVYSAGDLAITAGGVLRNDGVMAAANHATLRAQQLASQGTLGAGVAGDGSLQGNGALNIVTLGTLAAHGRNLAAGSIALQGSALDLSNAQTQAGGEVSLTSTSGDIDHRSATLTTSGVLAVRSAGDVDNGGGQLQAGQLDAQAAAWRNAYGSVQTQGPMTAQLTGLLDNTHGSWISAANTALRVGALSNTEGTLYAGGDADLTATDAISNTGTLAAQGQLTIVAGSLDSSGTLAAGLQTDGNLIGSAQLTVSTQGHLAATGKNVAAGALNFTGRAVDLHGASTRAGGDITLTARQGDINHAGGDLATNGRLAIQAAQAVTNAQARMQAGQLSVQAGSLSNRSGQLLQTGSGDTALAIGGLFDNTGGTLASNAANVTIRAAALDNTSGAIQHAGAGTLNITTNSLINTQGQLVGNGSFDLASTTTDNTGGTVSVAGDATLHGTDLTNAGGALIANTLQVVLGGTLINADGLLQANRAYLAAGTLANGSGQIKALDGNLDLIVANTLSNDANGFIGSNQAVNLSTGSVNNAGQIYAGTDLTLTAQGDVSNSGALQAQGSANVHVGGTLANDGGRLEAGSGQDGATLTLNASAISSQQGRIANAGQGDTAITANSVDNTGGTLGGQGDVMLNAAQLVNRGGVAVAGGNLTLQSGYLDNTGGTLYSAQNLAWNNVSATLDNTGGSIGAGGSLALVLGTVHNDGGDMAANGDVTASFSAFDGSGRLRAGNNLTLTLAGDYTNLAGNTLFANNDFRFTLGGAFVNASGATLQSVGALTVDAARIDNQAGALVNSTTTTLNAATQTNEGRIEGDTVTLNAGDVINTGTVIGNAITVNANNLTNGIDLGAVTDNTPYQTALIAAVNQLNLYITGNVLNRDAMLYTLGDLTIAADASGTRSQSVTNRSGSIEAGGHLFVAAQQITNERRVLNTETYTLTAAEQAANSTTNTTIFDWTTDAEATAFCNAYAQTIGANGHPVRCGPLGYYGDAAYDTLTQTVLSITRLTSASAESRLLAGGDITFHGSVLNSNSTVAAGNNLLINGQDGSAGGGNVSGDTVQNVAFVPTALLQNSLVRSVDGDYEGARWYSNREDGLPPMVFARHITSATVAAGGVPFLTLDAGPSLRASMSAGRAVDISAQDIQNTAVDADGHPVVGVNLGPNGHGQTLHGGVGGGAGNVGSPANPGNVGPVPGAQMIGTPERPFPVQLPGGGLYTIKPGSGSPYLVETDPRFASYGGFLGSDYLLGRLGLGGDLTLKRLGDAFYETQLVMDQITSLTGRRYLSGEDDALEQYKALMDAGAQEAQSFNLTVGVALTPDQVASLTQDMVWLVSEQVNGESVLVPVVYLSQKTAESVASGAVIQGTTVNLNASRQLTSTGTIQASQDASIKAGNLLNAGNLSAGGSLSVQAAQDLLNAGTIQGGNVALVAGNDLVSGVNAGGIHLGDVKLDSLNVPNLNLPATGSITAVGDLTAQAGHNLTLDHATLSAGNHLGLAAANDLTATASTLNAGGSAQLIAGNNLGLNASAGQRSGEQTDHSATATMHTDVTMLKAGGNVVLAAGNDLTSQAAQLQAGNQLALSAGHDITLNAVTDMQSQGNSWRNGSTQYSQYAYDEHLRGTVIDGANGVALSAGHDVTTVAANVTSANGGIAIAAGNDIHLHAGQENHTWQQDSTSKTSGFLSSTTKTTHDATQDSLAVGTLLSGSTVTVAAGRDITTQAAQIVATDDVVMAAGNNLELGTATSTHSEQHDTTTKTSCLFTSGLNLMIGSSKESQSYSETDTTPQGSVVGSLNGGVTLTAGNLVHITGSDVLSQTGTAIVGKDVTIDAAVGTQDTTQTTKQQQAGLTLGLGGGLAGVAQSIYGRAQASNHAGDDRVKALYAAQAAYTGYEAYNAYQDAAGAATSEGTGVSQGISLRIGIGASSASSSTATHDETAYGSRINSQGNVTIAATGGDLNLIASQVNGQNVALAAANNLNVLSQQESHTLESSNKNASGGVGIQIGSNGFGFYAEGSVGKGSAHGNGTTHATSSVNANDTLTLVSGNDTVIKGAQLTGNTVVANIGNNLLIQSEQDTDDFASKQQQIGGSMVIGAGGGGSFNYSQSKSSSHYAGVTNVSGIGAGSGGFDIAVGGNTHLIGGVIASSANPSKNSLITGTLTYEDIRNESSGKASSNSFGSDSSVLSGSKYAIGKTVVGNLMGGGGDSENHSTITHSAIANGAVVITDGQAQQALTGKTADAAIAGISRNASLDNQILARPDLGKLQANAEYEQALNSFGYQIGTHFTDEAYRTMFIKAADVYEVAYNKDGQPVPGRKLTDEEKASLQPGKDGKVYIADNGIFNGNEAAAKYADQHSSAGGSPQYYIAFPEAGNSLSELLVAGYQKNLENDFWGLTNATEETKWMMLYYGQDGLHFDGHSRGSMTIGNAMASIAKLPGSEGMLSDTTVSFFGPAYNAAKADKILSFLQDRDAINDPAKRQEMVLVLQNHVADPVGRIIGRNPATGGTIPEGSTSLWEMIRAATGQKDTSHNCYGASKSAACGDFWRDFPSRMPVSVPTSGR
jgi:filamentous hemagglutinin